MTMIYQSSDDDLAEFVGDVGRAFDLLATAAQRLASKRPNTPEAEFATAVYRGTMQVVRHVERATAVPIAGVQHG